MSSSNLLQSQSHSSPSLLSPSSAATSTTKSSSSSSSSSSLLKIRPREVVFHPPFQGFISNQLKLYNQSEHILAYKVKTTAPIRYCVRPNTGIIPPGESIDVQILLNCTKDVPSISMKTKDKFQIQSTIVSELNTDPKLIWSTTPVNQIMKQRLKAVFTLPNHSDNDSHHQNQQQQQQQTQQTQQHLHANDMSSVVGDNHNIDSDSADEVVFESLISDVPSENTSSSVYMSTIGSSSIFPTASSSQQPATAALTTTSNIASTQSSSNDDNNNISKPHPDSSSSTSSIVKKRNVIGSSTPDSTSSSSSKPNHSTSTTTSSSTPTEQSKDRDYFVNENIQLTNQIKQMLNQDNY
ncbi:major sperm protein domain-containing protein [Heterostelium album PN500]|uniref:Major sperm protein domain-containing protein n=1 Tax=Heterostelium pallidum (strain ATCC 26659 / Pp 5 / PN500) TaxID=670386 RepID=D3BS03_HETP5|nr:major sperm protein domain-containing protein [Heterostelium album PN500]EFA75740.1 major sperm protein domain-containing protein [Heterostelium album PN500]|eukprot:XP_020427874.1 major sperm protein domain-containing protein [Heterostelium album PN500]